MKNLCRKKLKLNVDLNGYKAGTIITLNCDTAGTPFDQYWFRRLKDAKIDNCVEWVKEKSVADDKTSDDSKKHEKSKRGIKHGNSKST